MIIEVADFDMPVDSLIGDYHCSLMIRGVGSHGHWLQKLPHSDLERTIR